MKIKKIETKNLKYLGKKARVTTVYYDEKVEGAKSIKEGLRLIIRKFEDGTTDTKLVKGLAGRYQKNVKFFEYSSLIANKYYTDYVLNN